MKLKVCRSEGDGHRYDTYEFEPRDGMTVLGALFHVQDRFDGSLTFRYSCRGAVCGACAMLINKVPRLACRTQVKRLMDGEGHFDLKPYPAIEGGEGWAAGEEVLVEPLPHLKVQRDLMVDMGPFFRAYEEVKPYFMPTDAHPERERRMDPGDVADLEAFTNCVLCGACYGACPVSSGNPDFRGPAALAKLFRFALDRREGREEERLRMAPGPDGWEGCEFHTNCAKVCPKGVPPNLAIGRARRRLREMEVL
jgi:succinate dehydrogenase / fumarate reductase iron-sulfur subunit